MRYGISLWVRHGPWTMTNRVQPFGHELNARWGLGFPRKRQAGTEAPALPEGEADLKICTTLNFLVIKN